MKDNNLNSPSKGLNLDIHPSSLDGKNTYTFALNARQESEDGNELNITNEPSNTLCVNIPDGFSVIGVRNISEIGKTIFWLVSSSTSRISYLSNSTSLDCVDNISLDETDDAHASVSTSACCGELVTIVEDSCLNFSRDHPIHEATYKLTNLSTEIYWTDNYNPMRWLDIDNIPYLPGTTSLDCNITKIFPNFKVPDINLDKSPDVGSLRAGSYQFFVAYANSKGEELSEYYSATNHGGIWQNELRPELSFETTKAIKVIISELDTNLKYINLAVGETIEGTTEFKLVGTFDITSPRYEYTYTGNNKLQKILTRSEIYFRYPFYERAGTVENQNKMLLWGDLESAEEINYQEIASNIVLNWETWRVPYNQFNGYNNAANISNLRGYMRDEIYAFEIAFILESGRITKGFHIPGREATEYDLEIVDNDDANNTLEDPCDEPTEKKRWEVYNTGTNEGFSQEYIDFSATHPYTCITLPAPMQRVSGHVQYKRDCIQVTLDSPAPPGGITVKFGTIYYAYPNHTIGGGPSIDVSKPFLLIHGGNEIPISDITVNQSNLGALAIPLAIDNQTANQFPLYGGVTIPAGQSTITICDSSTTQFYNPYMDTSTVVALYGTASGTMTSSVYQILASYIKVDCYDIDFQIGVDDDYEQFLSVAVHQIQAGCPGPGEVVCYPDQCYEGPYEHGTFGYWESIRTYPNRPEIWGDLAGQKMRHHKFPDNIITRIHDDNPTKDISFEHGIFPIGVKLDIDNIISAINNSSVPTKDQIVGYKILRANRVNNKSVVAKGLLYNVGSYTRDDQVYSYPNYPFNDLREDPFLSSLKVKRTGETIPGPNYSTRLQGFRDESKSRYTFTSPDTHFSRQPISGILKLETAEYGKADAHFTHIIDNAKYQIGTKQGVKMAVALALTTVMSLMMGGGTTGFDASIDVNLNNFVPGFNAAYDIIKKLIPLRDYGVQYNAVGNYSNSISIPNDIGNKIRAIDLIGYIDPSVINVGDLFPINNYQRESSVFIRTTDTLPYVHEQGAPIDNSRFTFQSYYDEQFINLKVGQKVKRDVSSYYASIKKIKPDQYGEIYSYITMDTGGVYYLSHNPSTVFGGDIFINRIGIKRKLPFFLTNTVLEDDNTDVSYNELGNVAFPNYYISTSPIQYELSQNVKDKFDKAYEKMTDDSFWAGVAAAFSGGMTRFLPAMRAMFAIASDIIAFLGIKDVNLDRYSNKGYYEEGSMYVFAYGIPYYFAESDINVDYRQAENSVDKNFFPNVGTDIPDFWLQEKTVSIAKDNYYLYNRDFSLQNLENYFGHLPKDFDPIKDKIKYHKTRVIYSEPTSLEERLNNWLVYKANNYHDFPLSNGRLISLKAMEQEKVLARFEDNMSIYNAFITLQTDNKSAITGTGSMFANPPQEFSKTDVGYGGTQNHAICSTKYGYFWLDAKRGNVFQLQDGLKDISALGMRNWFKENLPFKAHKYPGGLSTDNAFKDVGISMVWDSRYERLFITKKDMAVANTQHMNLCSDGTVKDTRGVAETVQRYIDMGWTKTNDDVCNLTFTKDFASQPANIANDTDVYAFFDTSSMELSDGEAAAAALVEWHAQLLAAYPNYTGNLYIIPALSELYLRWLHFIYIGNINVTGAPWDTIAMLPPNLNTIDWIPPKNIILLTFVDETSPGYHGNSVAAGFTGQPTATFNNNYIEFKATLNHFDSFKAVLYPVVQSLSGVGGALVLQGLAAMEGRVLTQPDIDATGTTVDVSLLLTQNVYEGHVMSDASTYIPLKSLGWKGVFNKVSPASEVFSSDTFASELNDILNLSFEEAHSEHVTVTVPVPEVSTNDPYFFTDASWTIAYSPITQSWISFYSFIPDYYIEQQSHFQSGHDNKMWNHLLTNKSYQVFYNDLYPFEIETITKTDVISGIMSSISYKSEVLRYTSSHDWKYMNKVTFNEAEVSSTTQTSGRLELNVKDKNDLSDGLFIQNNGTNISIPVSETNETWKFNKFSDVVLDHNSTEPLFKYTASNTYRYLNSDALDYSKPFDMIRKTRLKSDWFRTKLINSEHSRYKFIFKWILNTTTKSIR